MRTQRSRKGRLVVEALEGRVVPSASNLSYSTNWSGYAVTAANGAVTSVSASWTVPTLAAGRGTAYSAAWVGIDGYSSPTVEQVGTEADLINGSPQYYAWYEMYPAGYVTVPLTIHNQDAISATVSSAGGGTFALTLTDNTTGKSYATTQHAAGAQLSSAEWVVEAPSSYSVLPLANFGTLTFTAATATVAGSKGPIDSSTGTVHQIDLSASRSNTTAATTSALTDSGSPTTSSFSVTSAAPAAPQPPSRVGSPGGYHQGNPWGRWSTDQVSTAPTSVGGFTVTNGLSGAIPANNTALVFAAPTTGGTVYLPAQALHTSATAGRTPGVRPVSLYFAGDSVEQAVAEGGADLNGPAARPAAPAPQPDRPQPNALPPEGNTLKPSAFDAAWLEAVDQVFAEDFAAPEGETLAPPVWTGLHERETRSLAAALVVAGAVFAWQPQGEAANHRRAKRGNKLVLQVME